MALGPGPAGLKFWTPQGLTADNTADINDLPAGAINWFNPWGPKRPVQDWFRSTPPQLLAAPFTLTSDAGSYSLTGADAILALQHVASAGSYALTGAAAGLVIPADTTNLPAGVADSFYPWGRRRPVQDWFRGPIPAVPVVFPAGSGSYTLTGSAAGFAFGHVAGSGSYSITGSAAALALGHVAGTGSYTLTGAAAGLTVAVNYAAAAGSYTLTGSAATFAFGHAAGAGSYTLTGSAAGLVIPGAVAYLPAGMSGGYVPWRRPYPTSLLTRTGRPLAVAPVILTAAGGSYTITGSAAGLTVATPPDTTNLPASAGNWFNPWGRKYPVALLTVRVGPFPTGPTTLPAAVGSYTITGSSAALTVASPPDTTNLPAGATVWFNPWRRPYPTALLTRTGRPLEVGPLTLTAGAGSYTITGSSAALALRLTANSGSYTVSGSAAVLARGFAAGAGAYAILGTDAQLVQAGTITLTCGAGSYTITGSDVSFIGVTPPEVTPPAPGAVGTGVRVGRYRQLKLRKKLKRDECEELLEYLRSLPPAERQEEIEQLASRPWIASLLEMMPAAVPMQISAKPADDDDDDECIALLLQILNS